MKKLSFVFISIILIGCSTPKFSYGTSGYTAHEQAEKEFLNRLGAEGDKFSVVIFTDGFLSKEKIEVTSNNNVIFSDILETDRSFGLAESLKVSNEYDIIIKDLGSGYSFKLPSKKNMKYKYIYISKDADSKTDYYVNYSDKLQSFY